MASAYDFSFTTLKGEAYPLAQHEGKPLIVVNTASKCGFTPQYAGLQALSQQRPDLTIIGVPCNDFGGQEPGSEAEIGLFCETNYGVTFPMMSKVHCIGAAAHPFFAWVHKVGGWMARPRWNFYKYLINKEGQLEDFFLPVTPPDSSRISSQIERLFP